jgi:tetratricopeptide (TPR) repeat protein
MMRFHSLLSTVLAAVLVVPPFLGQAPVATLREALAGTTRALDVLHGLEQRLQADPAAALGLILSATEPASGTVEEREQRLESLRNEVNLLQMQLDALESPVTTPDGEIAHFLGTQGDLPAPPRPVAPTEITTGLDDGLRSLLGHPSSTLAGPHGDPANRPTASNPGAPQTGGETARAENAYSADPLRHGIACYRAGRYGEAHDLLLALDDATALYWRARVLERLDRMDEAVATMEKAILQGGEGFDLRRAQTDLEFMRWKQEFLDALPADSHQQPPSGGAPR